MKITDIENYLNQLANREINPLRILDEEIDELGKQFELLNLELPYTVKILGTNGKGSTAAMLSSGLVAAGLKVVCFKSPHLVNWKERIQFNNRNISEGEAVQIFKQLHSQLRHFQTKSYFTVLFLMAIIYTNLKNADVLVAEAGLGGRYDATRVLSANLTLITVIGLDHQNLLGNTVVEIALDKLGGLNKGTVLIVNPQPPLESLINIRAQLSSVSKLVITDQTKIKNFQFKPSIQSYQFVYDNFPPFKLPVWGSYQQENLKLVIEALEIISSIYNIDILQALKGLQTVNLPARFQVVSNNPLKILDGGHNQPAIEAVVKTIEEHFPHRKLNIYFSAMKDKDILKMLEILGPITRKYIFTRFHSERCFNPTCFTQVGDFYETAILPLPQAVSQFWSSRQDCLGIGSFHWVGELLKKLTK